MISQPYFGIFLLSLSVIFLAWAVIRLSRKNHGSYGKKGSLVSSEKLPAEGDSRGKMGLPAGSADRGVKEEAQVLQPLPVGSRSIWTRYPGFGVDEKFCEHSGVKIDPPQERKMTDGKKEE